jgi:hypothetical protein
MRQIGMSGARAIPHGQPAHGTGIVVAEGARALRGC